MRLLIFFLLLPSICFLQETIDTELFFTLGLANFQKDEQPIREEINFPLIDEYEFRTETRDFNFNEQEYTVRLSPSSPKIRNAQKAYYEELKNAPDFDGQKMLCDLKLSLHIDWLSLFALNENQSILNELLIVLNDKQSIYEKMIGSYEFDPDRLVKLQTEKSDIEIALSKITLEQEYLLKKHKIENQKIDFSNFITVEVISEYLSNTRPNQSKIVDLKSAYKKQLLRKEIELESSEKKKIIDFVQIKYNGPHSDALQERLSIGLGFQWSNSGNDKLKMQELQIEMEELNRKSARNIQEKKEKLTILKNKLQRDIEVFFNFQKIMEEEKEELQNLSNSIAQKESASPILLLDIKKRHLLMRVKFLNKKESLIKDYLKYLEQADKMCQPEKINYLSL
jgi:hypothetical protein